MSEPTDVSPVPPTAEDLISRAEIREAVKNRWEQLFDLCDPGSISDAFLKTTRTAIYEILETLSAPPVAPVPPTKVGAVTGCTNPLHNHFADVMHNVSEWAKCTYVSAPPVAPSVGELEWREPDWCCYVSGPFHAEIYPTEDGGSGYTLHLRVHGAGGEAEFKSLANSLQRILSGAAE